MEMDLKTTIEGLKHNLNLLKGKKIQLKYGDKVVLEKIDPTAEELISYLYEYGTKKGEKNVNS